MAASRRPALLPLALLFWSSAAAPRRQEAAPRTELSHPCSRPLSRAVRRALDRDILRPAQRAGVEPRAPGCAFDPAQDLWGKQERSKSRKRGAGSQWTCGICGKVFKNEHYVDLHMERKHMNEAPRGGVCLADYCEMFELCQSEGKFKRKRGNETQCDDDTMRQVRHSCEDAMHKCFPLGEAAPRALSARFSKTYCRVLDCQILAERNSEHHVELMPVIVPMFVIVLVCFAVFTLVYLCVENSEGIVPFLAESGLVSRSVLRTVTRAGNEVRRPLGLDRTKCV